MTKKELEQIKKVAYQEGRVSAFKQVLEMVEDEKFNRETKEEPEKK